MCYTRSSYRFVYLAIATLLLGFWFLASGSHEPVALIPHFGNQQQTAHPFSGAFRRFPNISSLSENQKRMTLITVWNSGFPSFFRHFLYSVQKNADVLDLIFINRVLDPDLGCMDFEKEGIDITWGGNIKVVCMDDEEYKRRYVDFMCGQEYGWNCTPEEYDAVAKEHSERSYRKNFLRNFKGWVFRDLFLHPENLFWGWVDTDATLGDFRRYPFNLLSELSFATASHLPAEHLFMAGQLTVFNFDDPFIGSAWKHIPELQSPDHFTKYTAGKMPPASEETYWSYAYMRSENNLPGTNLSWVVYPDYHGEDFYDGIEAQKRSNEVFIISGREIFLTKKGYDREAIEQIILQERQVPVDDFGSIGWTAGEDGSDYLLKEPSLTGEEAKARAMNEEPSSTLFRQGFTEEVAIVPGCDYGPGLGDPKWRQCVPLDPLSNASEPLYRPSLLRFPELPPMHVLRRLEMNERPRGYERKLFKHHHWSKRREWFEWPKFDITDDLVLRSNMDFIEVFKMGQSRGETIFSRAPNQPNIG